MLGDYGNRATVHATCVHHAARIVRICVGGGWTTLASGKRLPPGIEPSVGDWECSCGNWNWARRGSCNKCGASKPR